MGLFDDKVVLVTGSGRGIGREIALRFAHEGADVAVNFFRNRAPAEKTGEAIRALGRRALVVKANVGEPAALEALFTAVADAWGGLDILVHNAASGYNRPVHEQKVRGWDWTMNINARSLLFGAQLATPLMRARGGGAIVALSSLGARRVMDNYVAVGASKAALEALVRYLGVELAPDGIRVNAVAPGLVETAALEHFEHLRDEGAGLVEHFRARTPMGRLVTPADVADAVAFLAGPAAAMMCGQTLVLDGGHSLLAP